VTGNLVRALDGALLEHPELGKATVCSNPIRHAPEPVRIIWHHICPETCGGPSTKANLAALCDNCHYYTHLLLWLLLVHHGDVWAAWGRRGGVHVRGLALIGYGAAVERNTADRIPYEGGSL
jgi:hypothetical protein